MIEALLRILALIHKELLVVLKDRKSRFIVFVPPVVQCLLFGYAATYDLNDVPYVVVDLDHTAASQEFLSHLSGSTTFHHIASVDQVTQGADLIERRDAVMMVVVERHFERNLLSGSGAEVQVIADGRNSNVGAIAQTYVTSLASTFGAEWRQEHGLSPARLSVVRRSWYNPQLETRWTMVPSLIGAITMMMTMILTAMSVAREREEGTFDQLLVAPLRPTEIMIGKAVPSMLVGMMQAGMIFLVALFWFQIPFSGSFAVLFLGLVLFLAAAIGIGLFLSSLAASMQQAMILNFLLLVPFVLLSGFMSPIENMPQILQTITLIDPLRYAISLTRQVYLEGAGIGEIARELVSLLVIAGVTLPVAAWFFRHRLV